VNGPRTSLEAVYAVAQSTAHGAEPALAELGLTMATAQALWAIDPEEPPPTMKAMTQRLRCNASTLTFVSDRLARLGFITRTADPANRRYRRMALTPEGREARARALTALQEASPLSRLTQEQRDALGLLLAHALTDGLPEPTPA